MITHRLRAMTPEPFFSLPPKPPSADGIIFFGDMHLILADNAHLDAQEGIRVAPTVASPDNSLTIYAQSTDV